MKVLATAVAVLAAATGCTASAPPENSPAGGIAVVSTISTWGSIAAQLGGDKVHATSIISNSSTDPHSYEPTPADARTVAGATVLIANGIGYDSWIEKLVAANPAPGRTQITVGSVMNVPADGNPHQWYSPNSVATVVYAITAAYTKADPADAAYFAARRTTFLQDALAQYHTTIADIKGAYAGTPVGAGESIVVPLAEALGLSLLTPPTFLRAVSEGTDPSPADKATIDQQIAGKAIRVYIDNSQNSTPDVRRQVEAATKQNIPVTSITETLSPAGTTFQDWQTAQLVALRAALHKATGH